MQKISQILRETKIKQVTGKLIEFNDNDKLVGKCALGVLACKSSDRDMHLSLRQQWVSTGAIIRSYGLDDTNDNQYPWLDIDGKGWDWDKRVTNIGEIIVTLNDRYNFTFKQIADFLETFDL